MLELLKNNFDIVVMILQFIMLWAFWSLKKNFVLREEFDKSLERLSSVEGSIKNMPTHEELSDLELALCKLEGQNESMLMKVEGLENTLKGVASQLTHLVQYHVENK